MKIRLGYVAISLNLKDSSTSKTVTVTTLSKIDDKDKRLYKLRNVLETNLNNTLRVLRYNHAYNIKVYRLTSKLVPLATHPIIEDWNYIDEFRDKFEQIGKLIKTTNMRISAHPEHYTVINTSSPLIFKNSLNDLEYHNRIFEAMGLDQNYKLVMHIGGEYKEKQEAIKRFFERYNKIPQKIANRIVLENDDKIYNANDVLAICKKLSIPMVLDVHHYKCNNNGQKLEHILSDIFDTWKNEKFTPKVHFSSSKTEKDFRSHADYINVNEFVNFLNIAKKINRDFDVMLEAKNKDLALFKLMDEIKYVDKVKVLSESEFEY